MHTNTNIHYRFRGVREMFRFLDLNKNGFLFKEEFREVCDSMRMLMMSVSIDKIDRTRHLECYAYEFKFFRAFVRVCVYVCMCVCSYMCI